MLLNDVVIYVDDDCNDHHTAHKQIEEVGTRTHAHTHFRLAG